MQLHQLRYFCAVARTGNFTRAAQHEHLAQPSLSQQIHKLEEELGTRLFDRLGRIVRLTQMGEGLLPRAEAILNQVDAAKLEIQEMAGTEQGRLVIGAIPTIAPYFLPSRLASFARKFPRVQVNVVEEVTSELLNRLQAGAVTWLFLRCRFLRLTVCHMNSFAKGFMLSFLTITSWHPSSTFISSKSKPIHFFCSRKAIAFAIAHCRPADAPACIPMWSLRAGNLQRFWRWSQPAQGASVVPEMAVEQRDGCRFLPLADEGTYRRVGIVQLKQRFRSRVHRAFLEHLRQRQRQQDERSHFRRLAGCPPCR
jgi:LysR family transcriptional regulator, hydrogen peroxide-inducible genes activator